MNVFAWFKNARRNTHVCIALMIAGLSGGSVLGQNPQAIFPTASPVALTDGGFPIFTGDFNGDKQPDLAYVINQFNGNYSLVIVLSAGSNVAIAKYTSLCPSQALLPGVNFADVNNDGKLDLIYGCNGYLKVQLGNGDGTFQNPAYFNLSGTSIYQVAPVLADFNGDGYLDIGVLSIGSPVPSAPPLAVFLNQGAPSPGVFNSPTMYAGPAFAGALAAGDFNGDGKQDLIVAALSVSSQPTGFSVLYGNGDGTLKPATVQSVSPFYGFTAGDFNNDGITDLAFLLAPNTNAIFTSVQILLGNTNGMFSQGAAVPVAATIPAPPSLPLSIAAVHLTNDGNLDLVVNTNLLSVLQGDGKGGFTPLGSYAVQGNPALFADLNGDGKQDLIVGSPVPGTFVFFGNGDGTFQVPPGAPVVGPVADINNDGIADIVFTPSQGGNYFGTALGRGDGTFDILNQTTPLPAATTNYLLMTGDFNGDGKTDTIAVQPGSAGANATTCVTPDAQLLSYLGAGNGQFQAKGTALALGVSQAGQGITGDFNADGKLDIILPYNVGCQEGLLFLAGRGDGTFAAPVNLGVSQGSQYPSLIPGDLNHDQKLDFVWGDAVFLGNGNGTFKQIPLTLPADPAGIVGLAALADLNGDGILDAVSGSLSKSSSGSMIYAGKGDGTFAPTPFYTVTLPANTYQYSFAAQDVNGDGSPDLLVVEQGIASASLGVYLGDGKGNFTRDTNPYFVSASASTSPTIITPARLNNQAPGLPNDNKPDLLIALTGSNPGVYVVSLLNQLNPVPGKIAPVHSTTQLQTSLTIASPGAALTLTATVLGTNPTGSVSFAANGNSLGTEALVNGVATLPTSLTTAGSYTVTATYGGDSNNAPSTSAAVSITIMPATTATTLQATPGSGNVNGQIVFTATVSGDSPTGSVSFAAGTTSLGTATLTNGVATLQTSFGAAGSYSTTATYLGNQNNAVSTSNTLTIVIAAPDFKVTTTPASGTISAGQTATFMFTVTPVAGYSGTVKLSCGPLPAEAACSFSPSSVTPSGGSPASSTLTVTTAAATIALKTDQRSTPSQSPWLPAGLAFAGVVGVTFAPTKIKRWKFFHLSLVLSIVSLSLLGCGSGKSAPSTPATTPAGSYTVSVNATDSASGPQHAVSIALLVQ